MRWKTLHRQEVQGAEGSRQESPSCRSSPARIYSCVNVKLQVMVDQPAWGPQDELLLQAGQEGQHAPGTRTGARHDGVGGQSSGQQSTSPCWARKIFSLAHICIRCIGYWNQQMIWMISHSPLSDSIRNLRSEHFVIPTYTDEKPVTILMDWSSLKFKACNTRSDAFL